MSWPNSRSSAMVVKSTMSVKKICGTDGTGGCHVRTVDADIASTDRSILYNGQQEIGTKRATGCAAALWEAVGSQQNTGVRREGRSYANLADSSDEYRQDPLLRLQASFVLRVNQHPHHVRRNVLGEGPHGQPHLFVVR